MTFDISDADRETIVLGLAVCSLVRPGLEADCRETAKRLMRGDDAMFRTFRACNLDIKNANLAVILLAYRERKEATLYESIYTGEQVTLDDLFDRVIRALERSF